MKLYILTLTKKYEYFNFDWGEYFTEHRNIYGGVFNNRNEAENTAKEYIDNSPLDINSFYITECKINTIVKIEK